MKQTQIRSFVERYLEANQCQILSSSPDQIEAQLSVEVDQDLLNRPMYWMYVQTMQLPPNPVQFRFFFTETSESQGIYSDYLFRGSPRFHRMLDSAQKQGRFVRLYQQITSKRKHWGQSTGYDPILAVHFRVSSVCDQKRDELCLLAINLHTSESLPNFFTWAKKQNWSHQLPAEHYVKPWHLTLAEAVGELEYQVQEKIEQSDQSWAKEANQRLAEEFELLEQYYPAEAQMNPEESLEKKQRLRELAWQYQPRIEIEVVNAGLFHIDHQEDCI